MMLDIDTPKGQITLAQERRAIEIFHKNHQDMRYIETPKNRPAIIDGLIIKNDKLLFVAETKCRQMTYRQLRNFNFRWLVTFEKLEKARGVALMLCVPLYGFLYLVPDDELLVQRLTCPKGFWEIDFFNEKTETQATVNGGTANRVNAYIDMSQATRMKCESLELIPA